jgi:preprotein translocase subunit SecF
VRFAELIARFRGQREFHFDIIGRRRRWFLLSAALLTISILSLLLLGLNLGIDFRGGAVLTYTNAEGLSTEDIRETLRGFDREAATVQLVDGGQEISIRTEPLGDQRSELVEALAAQAGLESSDVSIDEVGPRWGQQISQKALQGLIIFLIVISFYISLRFEWKMALAAIVALFHDLVITSGVYALAGLEVTPETVIALLTILGYSLYDTVVIFDKVKENTESAALVARETYAGTVNLSLNHVLMRSINTSITSLVPVGALILFGGETLKNFAFALFIGIGIGTYSSLFVGAPLLAVLKEREPRMQQIRARADEQ